MRQTENMNTYAWRRTIYSMPGKLIPWWQLPVEDAIGYDWEYAGPHKILLTVITADSRYTSLVTADRAASMMAQLTVDKYLPTPINVGEKGTDVEQQNANEDPCWNGRYTVQGPLPGEEVSVTQEELDHMIENGETTNCTITKERDSNHPHFWTHYSLTN